MPARSRAACFLAVVALLAVAGLVPVTSASGLSEHPAPATASAQSADGNTTFFLDVSDNGDVEWRVTMTVTPPNGSEADLDAIADEYEDGDTSYLSPKSFRVAATSLSDATGREMGITDVERNGTVDNRTLSLTLSFTWTNFAERGEDELAIRDVFRGETGRWFGAGADGGPGLTAQQHFVIEPPEDYDISSVSRAATIRNGMIRWEGPVEFGPRTPYAVFSRPTTPSGPPDPNTTTTTLSTTAGPNDSDESGLFVPLAVGFVGLLAVVAYVMTRRDGFGGDTPPAAASSASDTATADAADEATAGADGGEVGTAGAAAAAASSPATDDDDETDATPAAGADAETAEDEQIDEELLSDEERVERLLERNGGRMKQANIVSETGWSNAKVSQLLSSMDEEGRIEKLRIGRENLISFPDEDITGDSDAD